MPISVDGSRWTRKGETQKRPVTIARAALARVPCGNHRRGNPGRRRRGQERRTGGRQGRDQLTAEDHTKRITENHEPNYRRETRGLDVADTLA